ncbi:Propeptide PepSY amd peptidase M4 [Pseudoxanthomonas suwonensis 11-1]|uniref:Propeptide PepSY amd peptidase M4 n=1 Tax=Pseudoxanthomonas suwonensis (strain 11-1) TaxID=743721 RepID=E6WXH7_PSEUU|nr:PepSY domain-containing protein [Pseudoxanthomonas suwonensis]ADV28843.1 Propeptide PepSY amd peptidase M4 [Pseudoxanthomonas suwonensis 11-1]
MKRTARYSFPALVAIAMALPAAASEPTKPLDTPAPTRQQAADQALTEAQVRSLLTSAGYTKINDVEFDDGMWEADATSANGKKVDVRVDAGGRIYTDEQVSNLSAEDVKARLTAAGYSKIHDVDFDDGIWKAEGERKDGQEVEIRLDPKDGRIINVEND